MDRERFSTIAHAPHTYLSPIFPDKLSRLLSAMCLQPSETLLDVGCGKGRILLEAVERHGVFGIGVDLNEAFLQDARDEAEHWGLESRVLFEAKDAANLLKEDRVFDGAMCLGATHALGDYSKTLAAFGQIVKPGGSVLIGEGFWAKPPCREYLEFLGGREDEVLTHRGNQERARELGFDVLYSAQSSQDEWDHYEGLYLSGIERFVAENPDDPDAYEMTNRIRAWRDAYEQWGRETLGFGWYVLRRGVEKE